MLLRKIIFSTLVAGLGAMAFQSCKPHEFTIEDFASVAVTNAVPGAPGYNVVVDGKVLSPTRIAYGNTTASLAGGATIYIPVFSGTRTLALSADSGTTNVASESMNFDRGSVSTVFYVGQTGGQTRLVRLTDDLTLPPAATVKVRFVHAAPTTGAVDVTFARGTTDSVTLTNRTFVGGAGDVNNAAAFTNVPVAATGSSAYTVRVKAAGTGNVLSTTTATLGGALTNPQNKIYTFFIRGGVTGAALTTSAVRNY